MSLIDSTYFKGRIYLPTSPAGANTIIGDTVSDDFIPQYEKEYLVKALGYQLYKAFTDALAGSPATKWTDLRDGVDYTIGENTYRWNGFINSDKVSPIAYYVYSEYMGSQAQMNNGTGVKISTQQNATNYSPSQKIMYASAQMLKLNESLYHYLNNHTDDYTEYNRSLIQGFGFTNSFDI